MFHLGRSGSTVLGDVLAQHSRIYWGKEIYSPLFADWKRENGGREVRGEMPRDALDLARRHASLAMWRTFGMEVKPFHFDLIGYRGAEYIDGLRRLGFDRFIILDRDNRLRKIVSSVIMHQDPSAKHYRSGDSVSAQKVTLDVERISIDFSTRTLLECLTDYDQQISSLDELLADDQVLRVVYEEDVEADPIVGYSKICRFLDLQPQSPTVRLKRTNPYPLSELIENYNEVRCYLTGTKYEWMLEESELMAVGS